VNSPGQAPPRVRRRGAFWAGMAALLAGLAAGWVLASPHSARRATPPQGSAPAPVAASPADTPRPEALSPGPRPSPSPLPSQTPLPTPLPSPTPSPSPAATLTPTPWPFGAPAVIGRTVEGRPIVVFRFGNGPDQRLIIGGIHGGYEWNTVALLDALMRRLRLNPAVIPPGVSLFILPVLNVDGYTDHRGETYGRANARGVDLNRNFPAFWQAEWEKTHCWHALPISAGARPFSEPETRAVRDFLQWPGIHIRALISYHSAAHTIFAGGQPPDPAAVALAERLARASGYTFPPKDIGCPYTGQLIDWAVAQGIPAVDVELTTHDDLDVEINWRLLQAFLQWRP